MPANKNALIRYKVLDKCLRNRYRRWTLDDLVKAVSDAMYDMEGVSVSKRTVQGDIQMMRYDKLGYYAPIEVYDGKYYRYSDPEYSITKMPVSQNDFEVLQEAVDVLRQLQEFDQFNEIADVVGRLQDTLSVTKEEKKPIIHFDSVPDLKGLNFLNPLYGHIAHKQTLRLWYQSFNAPEPGESVIFPYLLKEFRNRWFLLASLSDADLQLRTFALDRIVRFEVEEDIMYRENPDFDAAHFFDDVIGVSKSIGEMTTAITFEASPHWANYIITKPLHTSQKLLEKKADGSCIFQIDVVVNNELFSVLLSNGTGIKVTSPDSVVDAMRDRSLKLTELYTTI